VNSFETAKPADGDEIAARLLAYLTTRCNQRLGYAERPQSVSGGFDTAIFGFALQGAPPELGGRLILRLGREGANPSRFALEAATQTAVAGMGYPVPRVHLAETDTAALGGPFLIMARVDGKPLGQTLAGWTTGASIGSRLKAVLRLPATFDEINRTWVEMQVRLHRQPVGPLLEAVAAAGIDAQALTFDGQLARLEALIDSSGLSQLTPALSWLKHNRPDDRAQAAICHGDFHPMNIMSDQGRVTGVIDWANVVIAAPELDVASAVANISTLPIKVPLALQVPLRALIRTLLRRYVAAYRARKPLNEDSLRYYQVYRALMQLRPAALAVMAGRIGGGAYHSEAGIRNLVALIDRQAGVKVKV
jgi:aminoglycoside phosphotransferase (APT) family kinase protein